MNHVFRMLMLYLQVGNPWSQLLLGALLVPGGLMIFWYAVFGDPYVIYIYLAVVGIMLAGFGCVLLVNGLKRLIVGIRTKTQQIVVPQPYNEPAQYQQPNQE
ncbi:MAG TPA: hypothetical protein VKR06_01560 [Ktedonosporobacter sp.]|nr:hypothetical protein [Ktedonosporobacter sp.]